MSSSFTPINNSTTSAGAPVQTLSKNPKGADDQLGVLISAVEAIGINHNENTSGMQLSTRITNQGGISSSNVLSVQAKTLPSSNSSTQGASSTSSPSFSSQLQSDRPAHYSAASVATPSNQPQEPQAFHSPSPNSGVQGSSLALLTNFILTINSRFETDPKCIPILEAEWKGIEEILASMKDYTLDEWLDKTRMDKWQNKEKVLRSMLDMATNVDTRAMLGCILVSVLIKMGQTGEVEDLLSTLNFTSSNEDVKFVSGMIIANLSLMKSNYAKAEQVCREILNSKAMNIPEYAASIDPHLILAEALLRQKKFKEAGDIASLALAGKFKIDPSQEACLKVTVGVAYFKQGQIQMALAQLTEALACDSLDLGKRETALHFLEAIDQILKTISNLLIQDVDGGV